MLELDIEYMSLKIRGESYKIRIPSIKEHKEFAEKLGSISDVNEEIKSWIISLGLPESAMIELNGSQLKRVMSELGKLMMPV